MVLLEFDNVTKIYRRSHLGRVTKTVGVEGLTLSIKNGEIFGLLGLNGSGKTTTIKMILGLLFPTSGSMTIDGMRLPNIQARRLIGYLPEVTSLYKFFSAEEILTFYGRLSGMQETAIPERITRVLELVNMLPHRKRRLKEFSKGMQQRIAIAQAILHDPRILLFDEPVTGIDPIGLKDMRQLITNLNTQGKTIFFSSHSISEVEKVCHRVGILVQGRLARVIEQKEWHGAQGVLEQLFIETVQPSLASAGGVS